jgi:outer membrane protein assembly factor BamD (BamD/ComL family)
LKNNNIKNAKDLLKKSLLANAEPKNTKQLALDKMLMGDIAYNIDSFSVAAQSYQNISENSLDQTEMRDRLTLRKKPLSDINDKLKIIHVEDSLQNIAKMPDADRKALLKKIVRQIRKKFGLAEEQEFDNSNSMGRSDSTPADLFANNMVKGDWYFNNQSIKSMGYNAFKQKFGTRQNIDNWQRQSAATAVTKPKAFNNLPNNDSLTKNLHIKKIDSLNITTADLEDGLPLTKDKMQQSDDKIAGALLANGKTFQNSLENYPAAIASYNELLRRFPAHKTVPEALANLYTCYMLLHQNDKADSVRLALKALGKEKLLSIATEAAATSNQSPVGKEYERIYDLFIEGKFAEARAAKAKADSLFGTTYWTPQLLYIEAIDFVSNRQDSIAIARLNYLISKFSTSPIKPKAQNMIDILKNRKSIEDYLTKLQITRKGDTEETVHENIAVVEKKQQPQAPPAIDTINANKKDTSKNNIPTAQTDSVTAFRPIAKQIETVKKDSSKAIKQPPVPSLDSSKMKPIAINKTEPHLPAKKTDTSTVAANTENPFKQVEKNISDTKKDTNRIAMQPNLPDSSKLNQLNIQQQNVPPTENHKTDSALVKKENPAVTPPEQKKTDSALAKENPAVKPSAPEIDAMNKTKVSDSSFTIDPTAPQYVMILLNNVVYVFSNEARNAFEIYNSQTFTNMNIPIFSEKINDAHNAILIGPFGDAVLATDYIQKVKGVTKNIVPWLDESRYSFFIISPKNLELLRKNKKLDEYLKLLHKAMPERF